MSRRKGSRARTLRIPLVFFALLLLAAAGFAAYRYFTPYQGFRTEVFIEVEHGMSSEQIARKLEEEGVVRSRWAFLALRALHSRAPLQAGEYRFEGAETPQYVFEKIRRGEIFYVEFTIPEGSNMFDVAALVQNEGTISSAAFLKAAANPQIIRDLDPAAPSLEGYLFPSTYRLTRKTTAGQLCRTMTQEFRRQWQFLGGGHEAGQVHKIVTLASLVEKETAVKAERPEIASVFLNRLKAGMPLQCDPTTVYAALLQNRYRGVIYRSDLASSNPYNTYAHAGLPPGPIANPGVPSLQAALHPAASAYLYFVAKPNGAGSHVFSQTLVEHEKAVQAYRRGTR